MAQQPVVVQPGFGTKGFEAGVGAQHVQMTGFSAQSAPPGLEYLATLDTVKIHQVLHLIEVLVGWERNNVYNVCNSADQQFITATENTDCCTRQFCGNIRPFDIQLTNMQNQSVIDLHRDLHCQGCCCPCCLQEMDIFYPPGQKIATIKELWTCWQPKYVIEDTRGQELFRIVGDFCFCKCCADVIFKIERPNGEEVGEIVKHWGGCREVFGGANDFSVKFAVNEPVLNKAILLGATFLVDFMYFEKQQN